MRIRWLGRVPYREAWALQRALARRSSDDYLLLLEHGHVFTLGTNVDEGHVLVDPVALGAELLRVDRGGDVTYHGPGQLVGYPIVSVGAGPHRGPEHVRRVEQLVIDTLVGLGVPAEQVGRLAGYPGVWVGLDEPDVATGSGPRKICAIGVRTARGRTTHGFALNVDVDLSMFGAIVPCGIEDKPVTSLAAEGLRVSMSEVVDAVVVAASEQWGPIDEVQRVTDGPRQGAPITADQGRPPVGPGSGPERPVGNDPQPAADDGGGRRVVTLRALDRRLLRSGVDPSTGLPVSARKPAWLRVKASMGSSYLDLRRDLHDLQLTTVCEEAGCPNIYECWSGGTATFMINGAQCTRACGFCKVETGRPLPLDPDEPERVAEAVARMGLAHAVITCVARDDLTDGGAGAFATTIEAVRRRTTATAVEVLVSDCKGDAEALEVLFSARPDVFNHNIETVPRLQRAVRPSAGYARSLSVLAQACDAGLLTKSGIILGMGEHLDEVHATLADLRGVGVEIVTIGQYLRPGAGQLPVARWWTPEEFDELRRVGMAMGFTHVQSSPLTRSSYHAREAVSSSVVQAS